MSVTNLRHLRLTDIPLEQLNPLLSRRLVNTPRLTFAQIFLKKGCKVPQHHHPNEQLSYVVEGRMVFRLKGRSVTVGPGEVLYIPPNIPHEAYAEEDTLDIDVFVPPREDWRRGDDAYLRRAAR